MTTLDFVWLSSLTLAFLFGFMLGMRDRNYFWKKHSEDLGQQIERMKQAGLVEKAVSNVQFNQTDGGGT
jgi:hypothetical protein